MYFFKCDNPLFHRAWLTYLTARLSANYLILYYVKVKNINETNASRLWTATQGGNGSIKTSLQFGDKYTLMLLSLI